MFVGVVSVKDLKEVLVDVWIEEVRCNFLVVVGKKERIVQV
jgi:hypothetical protein